MVKYLHEFKAALPVYLNGKCLKLVKKQLFFAILFGAKSVTEITHFNFKCSHQVISCLCVFPLLNVILLVQLYYFKKVAAKSKGQREWKALALTAALPEVKVHFRGSRAI